MYARFCVRSTSLRDGSCLYLSAFHDSNATACQNCERTRAVTASICSPPTAMMKHDDTALQQYCLGTRYGSLSSSAGERTSPSRPRALPASELDPLPLIPPGISCIALGPTTSPQHTTYSKMQQPSSVIRMRAVISASRPWKFHYCVLYNIASPLFCGRSDPNEEGEGRERIDTPLGQSFSCWI